MTGLGLVAFVLSAILSWHYLSGISIAGCGGGSTCEQVLSSRWSNIAGILPVSGIAMGVYLALFVSFFIIGSDTETSIRNLAWTVMLILSGSIAGSAVYFSILQKWIIGAFCKYCIAAHSTGFLLAILILWRATIEFRTNSKDDHRTTATKNKQKSETRGQKTHHPLSVRFPFIAGLLLSGTLAAFQFIFSGNVAYKKVESPDLLPSVDYSNVPLAGSPDAQNIVTLLFDYQCSHCQKIHFFLDEATDRYNGNLAFALCPVPLNSDCNPYIQNNSEYFKNSCELAGIGLAVWVADRDTFRDFDNWMFTFESGESWQPRSLESASQKAVELVGQEKFDRALTDPWINEYIQTCIRIYGKTLQGGQTGVPKLIFGSRWVFPEPYNANDFITMLQNNLLVPKPADR